MPTRDPSEHHHRRSPRLRGYDYTRAGAYFVTICTQERISCFGRVAEGIMHPTPAGKMVQATWDELPKHYPGVELDVFVVMPDHIHGIIILLEQIEQLSLSDVLHRFKSLTTACYRHNVASAGWMPFPGRLWQRSYYEHIIRNEADLHRIRAYIIENPARYTDRQDSIQA